MTKPENEFDQTRTRRVTIEVSETVSTNANEFEKAGAEQNVGLLHEFWQFLRSNKKWWLLPMLTVLLLMGVLILLSSTAAAPFIYTLF